MDLTKIWKFSLVVELESYTNIQTRIASIETFPEKTVGNNFVQAQLQSIPVTGRAISEWHGYAKVFSGKGKKTVGVSMKPRNHVKKFDQFFLATIGLITVVKEQRRMEDILAGYESSYEGSGPFHSFFYIRLHLCLPPSPNLEYFTRKVET